MATPEHHEGSAWCAMQLQSLVWHGKNIANVGSQHRIITVNYLLLAFRPAKKAAKVYYTPPKQP